MKLFVTASRMLGKALDLPYAIMATAAVCAMEAAPAHAQTGTANTAGDIAKHLTDQIADVGKLVVGGSFLSGVGMVAAGLLKLKQAADSQGQQTRYGEGLWRVAVGAGLVALPTLTGSLTQTADLGGANISNSPGF